MSYRNLFIYVAAALAFSPAAFAEDSVIDPVDEWAMPAVYLGIFLIFAPILVMLLIQRFKGGNKPSRKPSAIFDEAGWGFGVAYAVYCTAVGTGVGFAAQWSMKHLSDFIDALGPLGWVVAIPYLLAVAVVVACLALFHVQPEPPTEPREHKPATAQPTDRGGDSPQDQQPPTFPPAKDVPGKPARNLYICVAVAALFLAPAAYGQFVADERQLANGHSLLFGIILAATLISIILVGVRFAYRKLKARLHPKRLTGTQPADSGSNGFPLHPSDLFTGDGTEITAALILKNRHKRFAATESSLDKGDQVPPDAEITSPSAKEINTAAAARFAKACDAGLRNRFSNIILEPANPFDRKAPRRLKSEAVAVGIALLSFLAVAVYCNVVRG